MKKGVVLAMAMGTQAVCSALAEPSLRVGETVEGFEVTSVADVPGAEGRMWRLTYAKNGAELVWFERNDLNRTFAIAFRTPPADDTGIPHILEHSVLCGSEKFPVKEPFVNLLKSSFSTFLNAYTAADYTCYPVSSRNERDFHNLTTVYLDAVFHPLCVKSDDWRWKQEGWHYEVRDGQLVRNGVVYSEMKGRLGSVTSLAFSELERALFPDTAYGFNSGGDPQHIPELTFEKYRAFYEKYYHPSNARIFVDGQLEIRPFLALVGGYLADYPRRTIDSGVPRQKPVSVKKTVDYPSEKADGRLLLADGWVFGDWTDRLTPEGLELAVNALVGSNEAPVKKALLEAGICRDVFMGASMHEQGMFLVFYVDVDPARADECRRVARAEIEKALEKGFDVQGLSASLSRKEFKDRELDTDMRGHHYMRQAFGAWIYGGDPVPRMDETSVNAELRAKLGTGWYEQTFRTCVLENPHRAELTFVPSKTLAAARQAEDTAALGKIRAAMSDEEFARVERLADELQRLQKEPDDPKDLAKLPRLEISDIPVEGWVPQRTVGEVDGVTVIRAKVPATGIVYLDFCFLLKGLSEAELLDAPLFADALGELPTARHSVSELKDEIRATLGAFSASAEPFVTGPRIKVCVSFLESKREAALALVKEILFETRFDDRDGLAKVRDQVCTYVERRIEREGCPREMVRRGLSARHAAGELFDGLSQLRHLQDGKAGDFAAWARKTFVRSRLTLGVTQGPDEAFVREAIGICPAGAPCVPDPVVAVKNPAKPLAEGYLLPTPTGFTAMAAALPEGVAFHGSQLVAARIISLDWLWQKVRVEGGAYGGRMAVGSDGTVLFASWMNPQLAKSFDAFGAAGKFLNDFVSAGTSLVPYQISTLAGFEPCYAPRTEASLSLDLHFNGRTPEDLRRLRREILATTPADLKRFATVLEQLGPSYGRCAFGPESLLTPCGVSVSPVKK